MVEYVDNDTNTYIVIEDPWPGDKSGASRRLTTGYFERMCEWIFFMLDKKARPRVIYSVNTRDEVIAELPQGTDVHAILGVHYWSKFLNSEASDSKRTSHVFEYNYRNNGHPDEHNWYGNDIGEPPAQLNFPVKYPYPPASWASPVGKSCRDFAKRLPLTRIRTPSPPPSPPQPPQATEAKMASQGNLAKPKFDLDPYEQEESALESLHHELPLQIARPGTSEGASTGKKEEFDEAPSESLTAAIAELEAKHNAETRAHAAKSEEPEEKPSQDLLNAIEEFKHRQEKEARGSLTAFRTSPPEVFPLPATVSQNGVKLEPEDRSSMNPSKVVLRNPFPWAKSRTVRPREEEDNERNKRARR